jgi:lysyl-tRNA synthetase, class II
LCRNSFRLSPHPIPSPPSRERGEVVIETRNINYICGLVGQFNFLNDYNSMVNDTTDTSSSHSTDATAAESVVDVHELIGMRKSKLSALRKQGEAYPNDFHRDALAQDLHHAHGEKDSTTLESSPISVKVAGRMMLRRVMGKASFVHLQDMSGRIQIYIKKEIVGDESYDAFQDWDLGDLIGIEGTLFKTKTGELTIKASHLRLLAKALRPLPDKFHGLADQELRYRQRYLDLIMSEESRKVFYIRSRLISEMRRFFNDHRFVEVETPMMQVIPGGAIARPFITHHNALDMDLYLRIAPELYLKRLVVGGLEKVYEINRNFRNEGVSTRHNPEFTMIEFYQAYADYNDLMNLTEELMRFLVKEVLGSTTITYQEHSLNFSKPFQRMTVKEAILHYNPELKDSDLMDKESIIKIAKKLSLTLKPSYGIGKIQYEIFEKTVEHRLIEPTFITAYPTEVSPLARKNNKDPFVTDRFEFFVGGRELANGFSELNDPEDQAARFREQVKEKESGDQEAMWYDEDYITALEYGMPPTAGEGIGIDRLAMLFTDSPSIRDVLLFPHMRKAEG